MKSFIAIAAVVATLPVAAAAQMERTVTCTVSDIQNDVGVCSKVVMPVPPRDVTVRVITRKKTDVGLGGLNPGAAGLIFLGLGVAAAIGGGSGSTPSTPGT